MAVASDIINPGAACLCVASCLSVNKRRISSGMRFAFCLREWQPVRATILPWQCNLPSNWTIN
eukprot:COSAG02_NODE_56842_length_283_cov_1.086957_1_plen_62_part_01